MEQPDRSEILRTLVRNLPDKPGVYQFFNQSEELIYVGKAKNLKKRVSSYFNRTAHENRKVDVMVKKIANIRHIVVDTESDALLLENNLIKKHQPRYNILLKDDKTYPWICIKNEHFPRVFLTRKIIHDGSLYFGPYTSAQMVRTLLVLIKQLYKLRTCNLILSEDNIKKKKFKICLEYHLGNCKGPCEDLQQENEYNETIQQIKNILHGNIAEVIGYLENSMNQMAADYRFEEAETIRQKLEILKKFQSKSAIVNPAINDVDVFSFIETPEGSVINFIKVIKGAVIQSHTIEIKRKLDESPGEQLAYAITDIRQRLNSTTKEIIVPFLPDYQLTDLKYTVPKISDKKKLLELSERNARMYQLEKEKIRELNSKDKRSQDLLETVRKDLHLNKLPVHVECFDNSNIQGSNPVAACVVFTNGRPDPSQYRHFHVKTVTGPDDFATMEEIVFRRYNRLLEENKPLPQLVVIDGGKGQLNAALKSIDKLNLRGKITLIGIAKKLEEIYFPGDSIPLYLDKNSPSLRMIQHIRNEAHRFGISFHRSRRSSSMLKSELEEIQGIGKNSIEKLLQKFKSVNAISKLSKDQMEQEIGSYRATLLYDYFHKNPPGHSDKQ